MFSIFQTMKTFYLLILVMDTRCMAFNEYKCCQVLQADLSKSDDRIKDTGGKFQIYAPFNGRNAYKHISKNYYLFYVNENQTYGKERWVIEDLLGKVKAPSGGEYLGLISHEGNETCPEEIGKNWQQVWSHPSIDPEINLYCTGQQIRTTPAPSIPTSMASTSGKETQGSCIEGYANIFNNSIYCFKSYKSKRRPYGRKVCEQYKGDLATFQNKEEAEHFRAPRYSQYQFGYRKYGKIWKANDSNSTLNVTSADGRKCMKQIDGTYKSWNCGNFKKYVCQRHKKGYHGCIKKLSRSCSTYTKAYKNITDAQNKCDEDNECAYLSTDNLECQGPFQLCNENPLKYSNKGCIFQKGDQPVKKSKIESNLQTIIVIAVSVAALALMLVAFVIRRFIIMPKNDKAAKQTSFSRFRM